MDAQKLDKTFKYYNQLFLGDAELAKIYNTVTFESLFNPEFLKAHSKWTSQDDMIWRSGFGIMNLMELQDEDGKWNVDRAKWDAYVRENTSREDGVETWFDFGKLAMVEWMKAKLEENKKSKN